MNDREKVGLSIIIRLPGVPGDECPVLDISEEQGKNLEFHFGGTMYLADLDDLWNVLEGEVPVVEKVEVDPVWLERMRHMAEAEAAEREKKAENDAFWEMVHGL